IDSTSLILNFGDVAVRASPLSGRGVCEFPPGGEFGEPFAEAINTVALFLVAQAGRIPVHAAAIMLGDIAVVLAGPCGAGGVGCAFRRHGLCSMSSEAAVVVADGSYSRF